MRKAMLVLLMLLAVVGSSAAADWADWVVDKSNWPEWNVVDAGEAIVIYADTTTIRKVGNIAQMWNLFDFKIAKALGGSKQSMSFKKEQEYDCNKQQARTLYISWHAGHMGGGEIIGSESTPSAWRPVLLGTSLERLWRIACGK